jgi:hypothetical protein
MSAEKLGTAIRRHQIAEAALNIVAREGVKGLNMSGLAAQVGLSRQPFTGTSTTRMRCWRLS